jgi:hypothetical protein
MTRPLEEVKQVLELRKAGLGARRISRATGIPVKTVQDWLVEPSRALARSTRVGGGNGSACDGACNPSLAIDTAAYSYLCGMYLGDGTISEHRRHVYRLRIFCCDDYPRIMDEVTAAIQRLSGAKVGRVQRVGCTEVGAYSKHWPCFFPQHGPGVKHEREIALADWQQQIVAARPRPFLRGLIQSDGWRGNNVAIKHTPLAVEYRTYSRYQFTNRSDDIRELFCWALDLLGVHWTRSNDWTIAVSRRKDVHHLDSFIGPKR